MKVVIVSVVRCDRRCPYWEVSSFSVWPFCNHPDGPRDIEDDYEDFPSDCPLEDIEE